MAIDTLLQKCEGFIQAEYLQLLEIVGSFDDRFMLVKGWSVTFGLATLALAIQKKSNGLLFVAALSALSFWALETAMKSHQTSYYPRMRQIEVLCNHDGKAAPGVDWAWEQAEGLLYGDSKEIPKEITEERKAVWLESPLRPAFFPHVFLPHAVTILFAAWVLARSRRKPGT